MPDAPSAMQEVESRWLRFVPARRQDARTQVWFVRAKSDGGVLGEIRWFGGWRRYAFFPLDGSLYEHECLRAIAQFVQDLTEAHRGAKSR